MQIDGLQSDHREIAHRRDPFPDDFPCELERLRDAKNSALRGPPDLEDNALVVVRLAGKHRDQETV